MAARWVKKHGFKPKIGIKINSDLKHKVSVSNEEKLGP